MDEGLAVSILVITVLLRSWKANKIDAPGQAFNTLEKFC